MTENRSSHGPARSVPQGRICGPSRDAGPPATWHGLLGQLSATDGFQPVLFSSVVSPPSRRWVCWQWWSSQHRFSFRSRFLGPSAFSMFFHPTSPSSSPRNALCGHALGILCGYGALWITGLAYAPSAISEGVTMARVIACALSLAATGASMILLDVVHPPAGATTLIVSLGIITRPFHLLVVELAVGLIVLEALVINRLAGVDYPFWARRDAEPASASGDATR